MSDNGFGTKDNSPDSYWPSTASSPILATGETAVLEPAGSRARHPRTSSVADLARRRCAAARPARGLHRPSPDRSLTGWDFDLESMPSGAADGTTGSARSSARSCCTPTATAGCCEAPIPTPGVKAPQNPPSRGERRTCPARKGFEGMAIAAERPAPLPDARGRDRGGQGRGARQRT